jgi:hypothetical protein
METSEHPRAARRSTGEWLFQLTTITLGVLIALSFDAVLRWNADRSLVSAARANIALEIVDNRRAMDGHLATFSDRLDRVDRVLKLLGELEAGAEPTVREIELGMGIPSLSSAAWQTAERTGALALMEYADVQRLADVYTLQSLVSDNLEDAIRTVNYAGSFFLARSDPFAMPAAERDAVRARVLELRAQLQLDEQLGRQLLESYASYDGL